MKNIAFSGFTLAVLAAASTAQAQSTVTLYGTIDESVAYYNNVGPHSSVQLQGANLATNKWGLKGTEDLGGGLQTVFLLENAFDINTGALKQGGRMWGKQAYVGLASDTLGSVVFGRQYDPTVDFILEITGDAYGPAFTTSGDADNNDKTIRVQNAIKYKSPTYSGLRYELLYGVGGIAGQPTSGQTYSAAVRYDNGGLSLATGYLYANDPVGGGTSGANTNESVTPLFSGTPMVGSRQMVHLAAQYVFGRFTANVRYSNAQYKPYINYGAFNRTETYNTGAGSLGYQVTPFELLTIGYTYTKSSGGSAATYNTIAVGSIYSLSKRTSLYASAGYNHASGTTFSNNGATLVAAGGTVGDMTSSSSTPNQVAVVAGIVHRF
jgi:predicted porin